MAIHAEQACLDLREVEPEVPDSNRGVSKGEVATHHESAQAMAHDGTANGVSTQPSILDLIIGGGNKTIPMPPFDALKAFLVEYYLYSRFQGRDGPVWGASYSDVVTESSMDALQVRGLACVSKYDSNRGRVIWFDRSLMVLNPDEAPAQIQHKPGNLTHIYGASL